MLMIYHNPKCSKSRQTLEIITESGVESKIVEYLKEPPNAARILRVAELIGVPVSALLRRGEDQFKNASDLPDLNDDAALAAWIAKNPKTLERPIVVDDAVNRAVVGRPPENVRELIDA
jgi:arsenate reductase